MVGKNEWLVKIVLKNQIQKMSDLKQIIEKQRTWIKTIEKDVYEEEIKIEPNTVQVKMLKSTLNYEKDILLMLLTKDQIEHCNLMIKKHEEKNQI